MDDIIDTIDDIQGAKIARYVTGRSSPAEEAEIRAWCAGAPGRSEYIESLRAIWAQVRRIEDLDTDEVDVGWAALDDGWAALDDASAEVDDAWPEVDDAWAEVRRRREERRMRTPAMDPAGPVEPVELATGLKRAGRSTRWPPGILRAAAVIVLALGGAALWRAAPREAADGPRTVELREYATERAQRAEMRLPDGTRVVLNVDSRLRVPKDYGRRGGRTVYLEGEALFEVEHDDRNPFVVHTSTLIAEDLGTVFGVRAYPDASSSSVVVAEGLVEFEATSSVTPAGTHRLEPGHLGRVRTDGTIEIDRAVNPADYLAFADARLVFRNAPMRDVAAQLGRWYGLDVRLADSTIASLPLTASFRHEPIPHVLDLIAFALGVRYERDGGVITFHR